MANPTVQIPPLPTPYDIQGIPYFPYSPGWLMVGAAALVAAIAVYFRKTAGEKRKKRSGGNPFKIAYSEIVKLASKGEFEEGDSLLLSLIARRALGSYLNLKEIKDANPAEMSNSELLALSGGLDDKLVKEAVESIVQLENLNYSPQKAELEEIKRIGARLKDVVARMGELDKV